ncbi:hypothetical protein CGI77_09555 [Vibrio parahaemolyticus]|uniref:tyrosine-type recombinase/integrase n=1 Tax=Vibrio parahaemolyticus TaxID=670 RepID=UPI0011216BC7|nr:integrase arm-type DNA-binding domain-containing protein [Vibrio parahaemolyticus]TOH58837.1 hypothetical protein CGI77_09555 [Vibrio parahaemolyticus]
MPSKVLYKLTAADVKNAKPQPKVNQKGENKDENVVSRRISDGGNLYLHVRKSGSKSWEFKFTNRRGRTTYIGLGGYPEISLREARESAEVCRLQIRQGKDPLEEKKAAQIAKQSEWKNTFEEFSKIFLDNELKRGISNKTYRLKKARVENHFNPLFGDIPLSQLSAGVAIEGLQKFLDDDRLSLLAKLIELLKEIMEFGVARDVIEYHKLHNLHKAFPRPKKNNLPSLTYTELPNYLTKMTAVNMEFVTRGLFLLQTHTLLRSNEVARAKWQDFDFDKMIWTVPGTDMKGHKNTPFKVPLTHEVRSILRQLEPFKDGSDFVFPSNRSRSGHVDSETINKVITGSAGYKGRMCAHGIRSMGSTFLNEAGFDPRLVDMCLAHKVKGDIEGAYNKAEYVSARREIMQYWSEHVDRALPVKFTLDNYTLLSG